MKRLIVLSMLITGIWMVLHSWQGHAIELAPKTLQDNFGKSSSLWTANDDLWKHGNGVLTGQTTEEKMWDRFYGCKYYAGGDYEISVKIKHDKFGEWGGGGLIFNSNSATNRDSSMMARLLSDKSVISGYFNSAGVYKEHKSQEIADGLENDWHTLKVHVKGNEGKYDVHVDGELILEDLNLNFNSGHFGLTICDGTISYKDFSFKQLAPAKPNPRFRASKWFGTTTKRKIIGFDVLTSSLLFYDKNGDLEKSFTVTGGIKAFASNEKGQIAAFSLDGTAVRIYEEKGKEIGHINLKTSKGTPIGKPVSAKLNDKGYLFVMTDGPKALHRFRPKHQTMDSPLTTSEKDAQLIDFSVNGKFLNVIDNKGYVYIYKSRNLRSQPELVSTFRTKGGGDIRGIARDDKNIYIIERDKVVRYLTGGEKRETFRGWKLARFSPIALRTGARKRLYVMDQANNAIITLSQVFDEDFPQVTFTSPTSAEISWVNALPSGGSLKLYRDGNLLKTYLSRKTSRKHTVKVDSLAPNTLYKFSVSPEAIAVPDTLAERKHTMLTPAGMGKTQYLEYPVAVLLFTNVIDDGKQTEEWPDTMKALSKKEIDRFKREINHTCKVYYMNSHMKYNCKPHYYIVEDKYKRSEVSGPGSSYRPNKELGEEVLKKHGKSPEDYNAFLYVTAVQAYSDKTKEYYVRGYGGGFTAGTNGKKFGVCWWEMTMEKHGAGNDWLMLHEFNHQTDSMLSASGHKEYWFNHYAMLDDNVGKFYWWYDADTYLIRETTPPDWWLHGIGQIRVTEDKDEDGIPDSDLNVWMDERRLGTSPLNKDTDGDELTDMEEVLLWNNSDRGWGEDYGGRKVIPDPTKKDSDGDGLTDGEDPHPMYTVKFEIPKATHDIQKPFDPKNWTMLYSLDDPRVNYKVYANWDEDYLYIAIDTQKDTMNSIALDSGADGWFTGPDNYRFQWGYRGKAFRFELYNCLDSTKFGFNDKELIDGDYTYRFEENGDRKVLLFSLRKNAGTGLDLKTGKVIALQAISGPSPNPYGWSRYVSYFEPNKLMDFKLVE